jgi:hypothetical protein
MNDPRFGQTANYANIQGYGYTPQVSGVGGNLQTAGLAKLPTEVRNKMGYKKKGGSVKMKMGGSCGTPKSLKKK